MGTPKQELWVRPPLRPGRRRRAVDRRRAVRLRFRPRPARARLARGQWPRMDLPPRDRAAADVAAVPPGEPGVHLPGAEPGAGPGGRPEPDARRRRTSRRRPGWQRLASRAAALAAAGAAIWLAHDSGVRVASSVDEAVRGVGAGILLFALCGFAATRLLLPEGLRQSEVLWVLPVGACVAARLAGRARATRRCRSTCRWRSSSPPARSRPRSRCAAPGARAGRR